MILLYRKLLKWYSLYGTIYFVLGMKVQYVLIVCLVLSIAGSASTFKVHKIDNGFAPILNFVLFQC